VDVDVAADVLWMWMLLTDVLWMWMLLTDVLWMWMLLQRQLDSAADTDVLTLIGIERAVTCDDELTTWQSYFTADR